MKDLGKKQDHLYDHPTSLEKMPKVIYPKVDLPLDFISNKDLKRDDKIEVRFIARVAGWQDTEYSQYATLELLKGEILGKTKEEAQENQETETTLLGEKPEQISAVVNL